MPLLPPSLPSSIVALMRGQIVGQGGYWIETGLDYGSEEAARGRILIIELPKGSPETRIEISSSVSLYSPSLLVDPFTNNSTFDYVANDEQGGIVKFCLAATQCSLTGITLSISQSWNAMNSSGYQKSIKLFDDTTDELLGFGERPVGINADSSPNAALDFVVNTNDSDNGMEAYIDEYDGEDYPVNLEIYNIGDTCRKFRLEIFIGNEGECTPITVPSNPGDIEVVMPIEYEDLLTQPVIVYFCLCHLPVLPPPMSP